MMWQIIIMGLTIGLAGSFHCIGMCGPLALSLPLGQSKLKDRLFAAAAYNIGRASTYFLIGIILGWTGSRMALVGYQQIFSIVAGVLLLVGLFAGKHFPKVNIFIKFQNNLKKVIGRFLVKANTPYRLFVVGLLNGLLPCGLVYMAIASALILGGTFEAGIFMVSFGLGTFPLMLILMITGSMISFAARIKIKKAMPYFIIVVASLMILRGLNLGIPYISPAFSKVAEATHCAPTH